jgi:Flp pilus assembly protein TadG
MSRPVPQRRCNRQCSEGEQGSVLILTIGFVVVIMLLVAVVVDASKLFLTRRALASVADGAAVSAAQDVDPAAVYASPAGEALPLSPTRVAADVRAYVRRAAGESGLTDLQVVAVGVQGPDVTVTLSARSVLPLVGLVVGQTDGVLISVTARARSAVAR